VISDALYHAIPGYGLYHGITESFDEDIPFSIKARNAALGGASHGLYVSTLTHHAIKMQNYQIAIKGYYSGPTHGWAMYRWLITRALVPTVVVSAGVVAATELSKTKTGNIGMQPIPGSGGGYSNPLGGSDETYYPFKSFFDWIFG
jgi:hypothetical protein